jgi:hypothetical protein
MVGKPRLDLGIGDAGIDLDGSGAPEKTPPKQG